MDSPFEVLGVDVDADESTIRRAYRERVKQAHPDQGGSLEEFRRVTRAYARLREGDEYGTTDPIVPSGSGDVGWGSDGDGPYGGGTDTEPARVEFLEYEVIDDYGWDVQDPLLFERAAAVDLAPEEHGRFLVEPTESLLEAAEGRGFTWPYSCRGGACANCAVYLVDGELSQPANHVLPEELVERGYRLSCNGYPATGSLKVVFNIKHIPELDCLILPPGPYEWDNTGE